MNRRTLFSLSRRAEEDDGDARRARKADADDDNNYAAGRRARRARNVEPADIQSFGRRARRAQDDDEESAKRSRRARRAQDDEDTELQDLMRRLQRLRQKAARAEDPAAEADALNLLESARKLRRARLRRATLQDEDEEAARLQDEDDTELEDDEDSADDSGGYDEDDLYDNNVMDRFEDSSRQDSLPGKGYAAEPMQVVGTQLVREARKLCERTGLDWQSLEHRERAFTFLAAPSGQSRYLAKKRLTESIIEAAQR